MMTIWNTVPFAPASTSTEQLVAEALRIIAQNTDYRRRVDLLYGLLKSQPADAARTALLVALASAEPPQGWSAGR
jgi:hypothetical protein